MQKHCDINIIRTGSNDKPVWPAKEMNSDILSHAWCLSIAGLVGWTTYLLSFPREPPIVPHLGESSSHAIASRNVARRSCKRWKQSRITQKLGTNWLTGVIKHGLLENPPIFIRFFFSPAIKPWGFTIDTLKYQKMQDVDLNMWFLQQLYGNRTGYLF